MWNKIPGFQSRFRPFLALLSWDNNYRPLKGTGGAGWRWHGGGAGMAWAGQVTSASRSCPGAPESRAWVALSRRCSQALAPGPPPEVQAGQSTWGGWGPPTLPDSGETAWRLTSGWRPLMGLTKVSCWGLGWARVWSHPIRALREPQTSPGDHWGSETTCRFRPRRTLLCAPRTPVSVSVWEEMG